MPYPPPLTPSGGYPSGSQPDFTPAPGASKQWREALNYLSRRIKKQSFATWFKQTRGQVRELSDGARVMDIHTPNQFVADWLRDNYLELIEEALSETLGEKTAVTLTVTEETDIGVQTEFSFNGSVALELERSAEAAHETAKSAAAATFPTSAKPDLNDRYRFDRLVVGSFNEFAYAASLAVAEHPGATKYNPLVIYGGVGLGKTHLAQSIGMEAVRRYPATRVKYATSEEFTNDFIASLSKNRTADFASAYRSVDVLLIDDIQFFSGKESTQEQFFHTFNALYNAGKQIVLTADRRPQDIKGLEARLLSRFSSGLVTDIQSPDLEARVAILKKKLNEYDFQIDEEILHYIATRITSNVRELEGALTHLYARASVENISRVSREYAERALSEILSSRMKNLSVEAVQQAVSEAFGVSVSLLKSKKRTAEVALARQTAMYLLRTLTGRSLQQIGRDFGGRDHTTVIHACSLIAEKMAKDEEFKRHVDEILESCR